MWFYRILFSTKMTKNVLKKISSLGMFFTYSVFLEFWKSYTPLTPTEHVIDWN